MPPQGDPSGKGFGPHQGPLCFSIYLEFPYSCSAGEDLGTPHFSRTHAFPKPANNSASQWALTKGYSSDSECNTIVGLFWIMSGILGISPWFERVPSKAQLADAPSRGVLSFGKNLGWRRLDFHLEPLWEAISNAIQEGRDCDVSAARHILSLAADIRASVGLSSPVLPGSQRG